MINYGYLFSILTGFFYALTFSLTKYTLNNIIIDSKFSSVKKSVFLLLLSNSVAVFLLSLWYLNLSKFRANIFNCDLNYLKWAIIIGFTSTFGTFFLYRAMEISKIIDSMIVIGGSLLGFLTIFSILLFKEMLSINLIIGLLLIGFGTMTIFNQPIL